MRQSHTTALELGTTWEGDFATEPYESAWAREALVFVRLIDGALPAGVSARVQIAPDGIHWVDEGTELQLPTAPEQTSFARVSHFGGWLRVVGTLPGGVALPVIVHLVLKE
jgi:hypothetical protein